eukprot:scaffold106138_cov69-Phaeocystis_antarctica.AAC.1
MAGHGFYSCCCRRVRGERQRHGKVFSALTQQPHATKPVPSPPCFGKRGPLTPPGHWRVVKGREEGTEEVFFWRPDVPGTERARRAARHARGDPGHRGGVAEAARHFQGFALPGARLQSRRH